MSSPTVHEIARHLGVSSATVSRALSGYPYVKEATRQRVIEAADKLGYAPNDMARALRQEHSRLIGLIVPDTRSEVFAWLSAAIQSNLYEHGYRVLFGQSGDDPAVDAAYLRTFVQSRVEGLIHVPCTPEGSDVLRGTAGRPPVVELVRRSKANGMDSYEMDDRRGGRMATTHLLELGHRDICMVAGVPGASTTRNRIAGFKDALRKAGVEASRTLVLQGSYSHDWGREAVREIRERLPRCTAIFAGNNQIASGVLSGLHESGVRIPDDISVVAYEDPPWFTSCNPGITTYSQSLDELGRMTAQGMLDRITSSGRSDPVHARVSGTLVVRGSTARPAPTSARRSSTS